MLSFPFYAICTADTNNPVAFFSAKTARQAWNKYCNQRFKQVNLKPSIHEYIVTQVFPRYGHTKSGFAAVIDELKVAGFAYESSPIHKESLKETELAARKLLTAVLFVPTEMRINYYNRICEQLRTGK